MVLRIDRRDGTENGGHSFPSSLWLPSGLVPSKETQAVELQRPGLVPGLLLRR